MKTRESSPSCRMARNRRHLSEAPSWVQALFVAGLAILAGGALTAMTLLFVLHYPVAVGVLPIFVGAGVGYPPVLAIQLSYRTNGYWPGRKV